MERKICLRFSQFHLGLLVACSHVAIHILHTYRYIFMASGPMWVWMDYSGTSVMDEGRRPPTFLLLIWYSNLVVYIQDTE